MRLWIVGRLRLGEKNKDGVSPWTFCGVFSSEEKAVAACKSEDHFIGPAILDKKLPKEIEDWPGAYYPLLEERPECL